MYLASGGLGPRFCFLLSTFCFSSVMALGRFGPAFILHPSSFTSGSQWGAYQLAINRL
jgi:hypothetical protein